MNFLTAQSRRQFASLATTVLLPPINNEPILNYLPGSPERAQIQAKITELRGIKHDIPLIIGGKEIRTGDTRPINPPHDHQTSLGIYHRASPQHVKEAIAASLEAKKKWENLDHATRISIFLKAGELAATKNRQLLNAATVLNQSKNYMQAEIDSACELVDFLKFNAKFAADMTEIQPFSGPGVWNRTFFRPLEGFVYCVTPFNFTAIACNLPTAPAMLGNTAVWKPSDHAILSGYYVMKLLQEAGLPDGVINFIPGDPVSTTNIVFDHPDLAGIHYTGSSQVFRGIYTHIGSKIANYKTYPRIVGETGGKNFMFVHPSAEVARLVPALIRGAFEYAGQKCSATSRAYIPKSLWPSIKPLLVQEMSKVKTGNPEDPEVLVNAVIHKDSYDKCVRYITHGKNTGHELISGGTHSDKVGYFVTPTIFVTKDPKDKLITEEIFGPIMCIYLYDDSVPGEIDRTLQLVDTSTQYALTGCIWSTDVYAAQHIVSQLKNSTGNLYINDRSTGSVVNQQPFGGARLSGTNDKAGSILNMLRWVSVLSVKENYASPYGWTYPYMTK